MAWLALTMAALSAVLVCWRIQVGLGEAIRRYRDVYNRQTHVSLAELFLFVDESALWTGTLMLAVIAAALALALTGSAVPAAVAGLAAFRAPCIGMRWLRRRRLRQYEQQLPQALLTLAAALRSGLGLPEALRQVMNDSLAPIAQEFGLLSREQRLGVAFDSALAHLAERVPCEANLLLVSALRVASHTGGNLAETLDRIALTLRDHQRLQSKIQTLTAQGRMQAWVVGALPLLLLGALHVLDPASMNPMWTTSAGWMTLGVIGMLEITGVWLIRRIVSIDI